MRHARRTLDSVENLPRAALAIASVAENREFIAGKSSVIHGLMQFVVAQYTTDCQGASTGLIKRSQQEIGDPGQHGHFDLIVSPYAARPPYYDLVQLIEVYLYFVGLIELLSKGLQEMSLSHLNW